MALCYTRNIAMGVFDMSKGTNQKMKLSYLAEIMLRETDDEHSLNMQQIKEKLLLRDVTAERKSIYNDLADLEKLGIEVIGEARGRDYYYHVGKRQFELAELKLLVDAIQSSKFITVRKSRDLIKKIEGFASKYDESKLQRQVYVHGRIKTMNESIYYTVDAIHTAIANNKQISFKYCEWNTDKKLVPRNEGQLYKISPWALSWDDENYYLIAYDSNPKPGQDNIKHYRVDKMTKIEIVDEMREGKDNFEHFDMAEYAKMSFGMYGGTKELVKLTFPDNKVGIFIDRFGKDMTIYSNGNGTSTINVNVAVSPQFFGWIFGLGPEVTIDGPVDVRNQMVEYIKTIAKAYEK